MQLMPYDYCFIPPSDVHSNLLIPLPANRCAGNSILKPEKTESLQVLFPTNVAPWSVFANAGI